MNDILSNCQPGSAEIGNTKPMNLTSPVCIKGVTKKNTQSANFINWG